MSLVLHNLQIFGAVCLLNKLLYALLPFFQLGCFSIENSTFLHLVWQDFPQKNLPLLEPLSAFSCLYEIFPHIAQATSLPALEDAHLHIREQ